MPVARAAWACDDERLSTTSGLAPGDELLNQNVAVPRVPGEFLHQVGKDEPKAHVVGMPGEGLVQVAPYGDLARARAGVRVRRQDCLDRVFLNELETFVDLVGQSQLRPRHPGHAMMKPDPLHKCGVLDQSQGRRLGRHQPGPRLVLRERFEQAGDLVSLAVDHALQQGSLIGKHYVHAASLEGYPATLAGLRRESPPLTSRVTIGSQSVPVRDRLMAIALTAVWMVASHTACATGRMGAGCAHSRFDRDTSKVIQIRDVPDEVHDALVQAAQAQGLSLTKYVLRELEQLAGRPQVVRDNAATIRRTQRMVHGRPDRQMILTVLHEGRGE